MVICVRRNTSSNFDHTYGPVVALPEPPATVDPGRERGDVVVGHAERVGDAHAALAVHLGAGIHLGFGGGRGIALNQIKSKYLRSDRSESDGRK